jgi:hypothetical protein
MTEIELLRAILTDLEKLRLMTADREFREAIDEAVICLEFGPTRYYGYWAYSARSERNHAKPMPYARKP